MLASSQLTCHLALQKEAQPSLKSLSVLGPLQGSGGCSILICGQVILGSKKEAHGLPGMLCKCGGKAWIEQEDPHRTSGSVFSLLA